MGNSDPLSTMTLLTQSLVPGVSAAPVLSSVEGLLALAMQSEQASEHFYTDLARRSQSESARAMFQHLSRMESSHFHLLQVEHDLVTQFPDYYNVEEFHFGEELIHLGP